MIEEVLEGSDTGYIHQAEGRKATIQTVIEAAICILSQTRVSIFKETINNTGTSHLLRMFEDSDSY